MRNRRQSIVASALALAALSAVGCGSSVNRASKPAPCNPSALLYSPGVGDSLGSSSFHQPMVVAYYEAMQAPMGGAYASVPTE
ncbi:MAG: hypothetical protein ACIARR_00790 [Phycisphaerales bacterium JB059]